MSILTIFAPTSATQTTVSVEQGSTLTLAFDPSAASFVREGNDLEVTFDAGGTVLLANFFAPGEGEALPTFVLPDGSTVSGASFLTALDPNMDLTTAAGPSPSPSSGLNEYSGDAGDIIGGVDRLGSLGGMESVASGESAAEIVFSRAVQAEAPSGDSTDGGGPKDPGGPGGSMDDSEFLARAVLYATTDAAVNGALQFRLLDASGNPVDPAAVTYTITSQNHLVDTATISVDPDTGLVSVWLSDAGKAALAAAFEAAGDDRSGAADVYDSLIITVAGVTYTMQAVLNQSGDYATEGGVVAEWHSETGGTGLGDRTMGSEVDEVFFDNTWGFGDGVLNTGTGSDRVHITGEKTGVYAGQATEVIAVEGEVDIVAANQSNSADGIYAAKGGTATVTAENITITSTGATYASGVYADKGEAGGASGGANILTATGDLTVHASAETATSTAVYSGTKAENKLTGQNITVTSGSGDAPSQNAYALSASGGKNILEASENGIITIDATGKGNAYALRAAGNDGQAGENLLTGAGSVVIDATLTSANAWALGMYASADGKNHIENVESVTITSLVTDSATAGVAGAIYTQSGGENRISGADTVELHAINENADGRVYTVSTKGVTDIEAENLTITAHSQGTAAYAVYTTGGDNTITVSDSLKVDAHAEDYDYGYISAMGLGAREGGRNIVQGTDKALDISISVSGGNPEDHYDIHEGLYAVDANSENVITGGKYTTGTVRGDTISIDGSVYAESGGKNTITVGNANDSVTITGGISGNATIDMGAGKDTLTTGYVAGGFGGSAELLFGDGEKTVALGGMGDNSTLKGGEGSVFDLTVGSIIGDKVLIDTGGANLNDTITFTGDVGRYSSDKASLYTRGGDDNISIKGDLYVTTGSTNLIALGGATERDDNVTITVDGKILNAYGGQNIITTGDDSTSLGSGTGNDTLTIMGDFENWSDKGNQVHMGTGNDSLEITGDMIGMGGGFNAIYTHGGNDTVTINGDIAARKGGTNTGTAGKNIIDLGDGANVVTINGSITAKAGGTNTILGGKDGDTIILNGTVSENGLTIQAGEGDDTLVLTAASVEEFTARYADWFTNLSDAAIKGMSIETLTLEIGDADNSGLVSVKDIAWLWDRLAGYNEKNASAPLNLEYEFTNVNDVESAWLGHIPSKITTGDGNDTIILNGKAPDGLEITAGGGNDTLVLQAGSPEAFAANYKAWLVGLGSVGFAAMGVESLIVDLRGGDPNELAWLQDLADGHGFDLIFQVDTARDVTVVDALSGTVHEEQEDGSFVYTVERKAWTTGNDDDAVSIKKATLVDINTGAGDDSLRIEESLQGKRYENKNNNNEPVRVNSSVDMGDGNDTLHVGDDVVYAKVAMGEGDNVVDIEGHAQYFELAASSGNDSVAIGGNLEYYSTLDLGGGNNTLLVEGSVDKTDITTGAGSDNLAVNYDFFGGTVETGDGADAITIGGSASHGWDTGTETMVDLAVNTGEGNDTLTIGGGLSGRLNSHNFDQNAESYGTTVNMGEGADVLHVGGSVAAVVVDMGAGNDLATIGGTLTASDIAMGMGDDTLTIDGGLRDAWVFPEGVENFHYIGNSIDMGDGADMLTIAGGSKFDFMAVRDIGADDTRWLSGHEITMGEGNDTLVINGGLAYSSLDGGVGDGDVLELGIDSSDAVERIFGAEGHNTITGFETLVLNMDNASNESIALDHILGIEGFGAVYIRGNEGDSIALAADSGWTKADGDPHMADGIAYDLYQNSAGDDVYVEQLIAAITGG